MTTGGAASLIEASGIGYPAPNECRECRLASCADPGTACGGTPGGVTSTSMCWRDSPSFGPLNAFLRLKIGRGDNI